MSVRIKVLCVAPILGPIFSVQSGWPRHASPFLFCDFNFQHPIITRTGPRMERQELCPRAPNPFSVCTHYYFFIVQVTLTCRTVERPCRTTCHLIFVFVNSGSTTPAPLHALPLSPWPPLLSFSVLRGVASSSLPPPGHFTTKRPAASSTPTQLLAPLLSRRGSQDRLCLEQQTGCFGGSLGGSKHLPWGRSLVIKAVGTPIQERLE